MDYSNESLERLNELTVKYLFLHFDEGGRSESDTSINGISRATITVFQKEYGTCYMGKINQHTIPENQEPDLVLYENQEISNFEYDFILPCYDAQIVQLIREHNTPKEFDETAARTIINKIFTRVSILNGCSLIWV